MQTVGLDEKFGRHNITCNKGHELEMNPGTHAYIMFILEHSIKGISCGFILTQINFGKFLYFMGVIIREVGQRRQFLCNKLSLLLIHPVFVSVLALLL